MVTPQDTERHIIGSGALQYPWWGIADHHGIEEIDAPDDWYIILAAGDEEFTSERKWVDSSVLLRVIGALAITADNALPQFMNKEIPGKCMEFMKGSENVDFDANDADEVLQYVVIGDVIYS